MISCATLYPFMFSERESVSENARVLIVDDNALDRTLLQAHLSANGYELDFASDGVEAMSILAESPVDLVLTGPKNRFALGRVAQLGHDRQVETDRARFLGAGRLPELPFCSPCRMSSLNSAMAWR